MGQETRETALKLTPLRGVDRIPDKCHGTVARLQFSESRMR
jgi:hypothetical protein